MTNLNHKIETCILRVESLDGYPQGTGFILTPTLAVTCAHVVDACGTGPGLRERIERWIAAAHHRAVLDGLRRFREELEREMEPVPWTELEAPMVTLLADVCDALALTTEERGVVLGQEGERALSEFLESRPEPRSRLSMNERQDKAMAYVREHGEINLSVYRELCPFWSDETLRLDLANLVKRKMLAKNGDKRGTVYKLAA